MSSDTDTVKQMLQSKKNFISDCSTCYCCHLICHPKKKKKASKFTLCLRVKESCFHFVSKDADGYRHQMTDGKNQGECGSRSEENCESQTVHTICNGPFLVFSSLIKGGEQKPYISILSPNSFLCFLAFSPLPNKGLFNQSFFFHVRPNQFHIFANIMQKPGHSVDSHQLSSADHNISSILP